MAFSFSKDVWLGYVENGELPIFDNMVSKAKWGVKPHFPHPVGQSEE